jgi:hypothetical protein
MAGDGSQIIGNLDLGSLLLGRGSELIQVKPARFRIYLCKSRKNSQVFDIPFVSRDKLRNHEPVGTIKLDDLPELKKLPKQGNVIAL